MWKGDTKDMKRKPLIGVLPLYDLEKESYWMLPGYMKGIEEAGGIPVMLPVTSDPDEIRQLSEEMDGYLFTGGPDIEPSLYGEEKCETCGVCCDLRDAMEIPMFHAVYEKNKPIFGICRGIQLINTALGGTLYQDLPSEHPSSTVHRQTVPPSQPTHSVTLIADTPLREVIGTDTMMVNSCHHQAIKTLGKDLSVMAVSEDGLIESVYAPEKYFVQAVQWHPEFMHLVNENSRKILRHFVKACEEYIERH